MSGTSRGRSGSCLFFPYLLQGLILSLKSRLMCMRVHECVHVYTCVCVGSHTCLWVGGCGVYAGACVCTCNARVHVQACVPVCVCGEFESGGAVRARTGAAKSNTAAP